MPYHTLQAIKAQYPFIRSGQIREVATVMPEPEIRPNEWTAPAFYCDPYTARHQWRGTLWTLVVDPAFIVEIKNDPSLLVGSTNGEFSWTAMQNRYESRFIKTALQLDGSNPNVRRNGSMNAPFFARICCEPAPGETLPPSGLLSLDKSG